MKHETGEHDQMKTRQRRGKPLIIAHQPEVTCGPSEGAFHHPSPGSKTKPRLAKGAFDDFQLHATLLGSFRRTITGIPLINEGTFDRLTRHLLYGLSKLAHLCTVLLIGRGHQQAQQIAQRLDCSMYFVAEAKLGSA